MTKAQKAEATNTTIEFEFRGDTYTIDPLRVTWEAMDREAAGDLMAVTRELLGDEQWAQFATENPHPLEVNDDGVLVSISSELREAVLTALGNFGASLGS